MKVIDVSTTKNTIDIINSRQPQSTSPAGGISTWAHVTAIAMLRYPIISGVVYPINLKQQINEEHKLLLPRMGVHFRDVHSVSSLSLYCMDVLGAKA
jgi:hypothetical protein